MEAFYRMTWVGAGLNQRNALLLLRDTSSFQPIVLSQSHSVQGISWFKHYLAHFSNCREHLHMILRAMDGIVQSK